MTLHVTYGISQAHSPKRLRDVCNTACQADAPRRARRGFTLVETLVALLIVGMISAIIAMGAPSAIKAYQSTVAKSNAQTVLATMTTALRDELGSATKVKLNGSVVVSYECGEGYVAKLEGTKDEIDAEGHRGPVKEVVDGRLASANGATGGTEGETGGATGGTEGETGGATGGTEGATGGATTPKNPSWALVPDKQVVSTQNDLYATFDSITFDEASQSFKVTNLGVYQEGKSSPIASIAAGYYSIRSPYCEVVTKWPWES